MQRFSAELKHISRRPLIAFVGKTKFATRTTKCSSSPANGECDPGEVRTTQKWAKNELTTLFGLLAGQAKWTATSVLLGVRGEQRGQCQSSRKAMLLIKHILTGILSSTSTRQLFCECMSCVWVCGCIYWRFISIRICRVLV